AAMIAAIAAPATAQDEPHLELTADLIEHVEEEPADEPAPEPAWEVASEQPATVDVDPLDLAIPAEAPAAPAEAEDDVGFTFSDE
ncbi:hypothetical protein ABTL67_19785, partial [Acinetobacter baumannii]